MVNIWQCLGVALLLRVILMYYGIWQDNNMEVKYTDIDYHVFTDAAKFVTQGKSPYERATYRYTPFLAIMLTPNIYLDPLFGKVLFIICDVLAGYLIYTILIKQSHSETVSIACASLWLFNPMPATVSSRGNAESIMAVLVLNTLYLLQNKYYKLAACVYATSVHMKIYPAVYALPIYLFLEDRVAERNVNIKTSRTVGKHSVMTFIKKMLPNRTRLVFICISASVFISLTGLCYLRYGEEFLQETYFYHITRRDVRHNFSAYFYMLYLTAETNYSFLIGLAAFIPQTALLLSYSFQHYTDLPYTFFLNTFVFVTFNKVVTSQYFLWYLCLLPLIVPSLRKIGLVQTVVMVTSWFLAQAVWLSVAYKLEFEGKDVMFQLWLCSLLFLVVNVGILFKVTQNYSKSKREKRS